MLKKLVECVTGDVKGQKLKVECSKLNVQSSTSSLSEIPFSKGQGVGSPLVPASGLCLVFTDANTMFAPDALRRLVQPFSDSKVGGVCGRLVFEDCVTFNSSSEPSYWNLETRLKVAESELDSCLGANGAIYAIRAELFPSLFPENTIIDDFVIGMKVREQGCRFVFAPDAMATEELPATIQDEWRRRVRIGAGAYQALVLCRRCLLPVYGVFAWMFWSHKVLRWFTPHMGVGVLWMSGYWLLAGDDRVAGVLLGSLLVIAIMAGLTKRGRKGCQLFAYFLVIQVALFAGFLRFCRGNLSGTWIRTGRKG
jgi:cellulose synthase/poly-beta-1,6-N-acetylglucosamine synthase-like glycosyltransferase